MTKSEILIEHSTEIWLILVEHVGLRVSKESLSDLIRAFEDPSLREYRFMGSLGFGGKFWCYGRWHVTCYREDETPERLKAIEAANEELRRLWEGAQAEAGEGPDATELIVSRRDYDRILADTGAKPSEALLRAAERYKKACFSPAGTKIVDALTEIRDNLKEKL